MRRKSLALMFAVYCLPDNQKRAIGKLLDDEPLNNTERGWYIDEKLKLLVDVVCGVEPAYMIAAKYFVCYCAQGGLFKWTEGRKLMRVFRERTKRSWSRIRIRSGAHIISTARFRRPCPRASLRSRRAHRRGPSLRPRSASRPSAVLWPPRTPAAPLPLSPSAYAGRVAPTRAAQTGLSCSVPLRVRVLRPLPRRDLPHVHRRTGARKTWPSP